MERYGRSSVLVGRNGKVCIPPRFRGNFEKMAIIVQVGISKEAFFSVFSPEKYYAEYNGPPPTCYLMSIDRRNRFSIPDSLLSAVLTENPNREVVWVAKNDHFEILPRNNH